MLFSMTNIIKTQSQYFTNFNTFTTKVASFSANEAVLSDYVITAPIFFRFHFYI